MSNGKHSFVRMTKLTNVRGRVRYITDQKRQENLYATYTNVPQKCWYYLAKENQRDFKKSGTDGFCIEARELIIMLPPSLIEYDHEALLKYFTGRFALKYDVACQAALHHNKAKTNLHIHLIFSERKSLDEPERKIAKRNMFYDEKGKHVRTKKEILDSEGNVRPGCKIVKKGEVYETNLFAPKNPYFKSKGFLNEAKELFTELSNELVKEESEKLSVYRPGGPYLATKKIGKNNPKADEIKTDNYLRQEWNHMVDRAIVTGVLEEEIMAIKAEHITKPVAESMKTNGVQPKLFTWILQKAIGALRSFIEYCVAYEKAEKDRYGNPIFYTEQKFDATPAALPHREPYPSSEKEQMRMMELSAIEDKLKSANRKIYAIEQNKIKLEKQLSNTSKGFFHRKERRELEEKIAAKELQLQKAKSTFDTIPTMYGFSNVSDFKKAFRKAKADLAAVQKLQEEWKKLDSGSEKVYQIYPANAYCLPEKEQKSNQKKSIKERLAENKAEIKNQSMKPKKKVRDQDCL